MFVNCAFFLFFFILMVRILSRSHHIFYGQVSLTVRPFCHTLDSSLSLWAFSQTRDDPDTSHGIYEWTFNYFFRLSFFLHYIYTILLPFTWPWREGFNYLCVICYWPNRTNIFSKYSSKYNKCLLDILCDIFSIWQLFLSLNLNYSEKSFYNLN